MEETRPLFFSHLTHIVYSFNDLDSIYLAGDLNGRIGDKSDFIDGIDNVPKRVAIDTQFLGHGDAILDFCNETKMCIINGRISPLNDNFTSISSRGSAVVDYMLTPYENLASVHDFQVVTMSSIVESLGAHNFVSSPSRISDHSLIIMEVYVRDAETSAGIERDGDSDCEPQSAPMYGASSGGHGPRLPPRFAINNNVPADFMSSTESTEKINALIEKISTRMQSQEHVNRLYDEFVNIFVTEMQNNFREITSLPLSSRKLRFTKKDWWDDELADSFKCMQKAEHEYIKAKKKRSEYKSHFSKFKDKQNVFDRMLKRKKT